MSPGSNKIPPQKAAVPDMQINAAQFDMSASDQARSTYEASPHDAGIHEARTQQRWMVAYHEAALEAKVRNMPGRIHTARQAITERLRDLEGDSDHHAERHQIISALTALSVLESEAKNWRS